MRSLLFIVVLLSGCATTKVGDLEILNDMGRSGRTTGEVMRTIDSSCKVLTGHSCDRQQLNTAQINRTYGEIKQVPYYRHAPLPHILQEVQIFTR
jgi:hypothetical protein